MKLTIKYQENYSRGELLLRSLFGFIYIVFPHIFLLLFVSIWASILSFISFWAILFTGRYPQSFFEFQVNLMHWNTRLNARLYNISDGYPAFGLQVEDEFVKLEVPYPESISRGMTLVRALFGWIYVLLPHGFILTFLTIGVSVVSFLNFWIVLFTSKMPESFHKFIEGYMRWSLRVNLYLGNMTDTYPPFSLDPEPAAPHASSDTQAPIEDNE